MAAVCIDQKLQVSSVKSRSDLKPTSTQSFHWVTYGNISDADGKF